MKIGIFIILGLLLSLNLFASEELSVYSRIDKDGSTYVLHKGDSGQIIPFIAGNEEVKKLLADASGSIEAIVRGHITYQMEGGDDRRTLKPFFVVTEIRPISLTEIGKISMDVPEFRFKEHTEFFYPHSPTFPVTTEVASAITLTSAFILMNTLANEGNTAKQEQINTGLFLSAGAMATILFIYDQLSGKTKP